MHGNSNIKNKKKLLRILHCSSRSLPVAPLFFSVILSSQCSLLIWSDPRLFFRSLVGAVRFAVGSVQPFTPSWLRSYHLGEQVYWTIYLLRMRQILVFYHVHHTQYFGYNLDECDSIPSSNRDATLLHRLDPRLLWNFTLWNSTKPIELTEETLPVHNKTNIKLYTSIYLSFTCNTCKELTTNLKLIDILIVSPDTSTVSMARYAD